MMFGKYMGLSFCKHGLQLSISYSEGRIETSVPDSAVCPLLYLQKLVYCKMHVHYCSILFNDSLVVILGYKLHRGGDHACLSYDSNTNI